MHMTVSACICADKKSPAKPVGAALPATIGTCDRQRPPIEQNRNTIDSILLTTLYLLRLSAIFSSYLVFFKGQRHSSGRSGSAECRQWTSPHYLLTTVWLWGCRTLYIDLCVFVEVFNFVPLSSVSWALSLTLSSFFFTSRRSNSASGSETFQLAVHYLFWNLLDRDISRHRTELIVAAGGVPIDPVGGAAGCIEAHCTTLSI